MNWRKHIVLVVGGGTALLLLIAALVMLLRFQGRYGEVNRKLSSALSRMQQLNNRDPFPSADNIALMQKNLEAMQSSALALQQTLRRAQLTEESIEPAEFAPLLERVTKRLKARADEAGVTLPDNFTFGFSRYAAGELPSTSAIPRLVVQLKAVDAVCNLLFQAHIANLLNIDRDVFESAEASTASDDVVDMRRGRRAALEQTAAKTVHLPAAETNELYGTERLSLTFTARETAAWDVINALARSPAFLVVEDVRMQNTAAAEGTLGTKQPPKPLGGESATTAGGAPNPLAHYASHDERVVAGREPVRVSLVLDLYRFTDALKEEASR